MEKNKDNKKALGRGLAALIGGGELEVNSSEPPAEIFSPTIPLPPEEEKKVPPAAPVATPVIAQQKIQQTAAPVKAPAPIAAKAPVASEPSGQALKIDIDLISANVDQPRKVFNEAKLTDLALSIKEQGIIQPITVKKIGGGKYQIIAGERRWRAARLAGLSKVPVTVREETATHLDNELAALVENIQRENLTPIELAQAYDRLLKTNQFTQESLAKKLGLSRVAVANTVRLLRLPQQVQDYVTSQRLSEGHARTLLSLADDESMLQAADKIMEAALSVREAEVLVRSLLANAQKTGSTKAGGINSLAETKSPEVLALEDEFRTLFGSKVALRGSLNRGSIEVYYSNPDSAHRIINLLRSIKS